MRNLIAIVLFSMLLVSFFCAPTAALARPLKPEPGRHVKTAVLTQHAVIARGKETYKGNPTTTPTPGRAYSPYLNVYPDPDGRYTNWH